MAMGLQTASLRARGADRVSPGPEIGELSCSSAKPGNRSAVPVPSLGPSTHAPPTVSICQIVPHPAHLVVPLKFQKGEESRKFLLLHFEHVSSIVHLLHQIVS